MQTGMGRLLAIAAVLAGLGVFFVIQAQGVDRAFGGALARFGKSGSPTASAEPEPARRQGPDWWEREEGGSRRPPGIGQGVRERVNRSMETGAKRHGGGGS
jgi:hypothetical protein